MKIKFALSALGLATAAVLGAPTLASAQTASDYSYVGIGGTEEGFAVNGKVSLIDNLSVRPAVSTDFDFNDGDDVDYVLPITYDFDAIDSRGRLYPFLGAGIAGELGEDSTIDVAVTGGADYRLSERWLVNGSVVWSPFEDDDSSEDVGFVAGVGYSF